MVGTEKARPLLRADGLVTRRGGCGCDITLTAGEHIGILGASGSGKTVFLRTLASLQAPFGGRLFWDEVDVTRTMRRVLGKRRFLRKHGLFVAMLFTNPYTSLEPWAAVRHFLAKPDLAAIGRGERSQQQRLPDIAASGHVKALSGVGRMRLALMYALQNDPRVVLIDDGFRMVVPEIWEQLIGEFFAQIGASRGVIVASRFWQVIEHTDYVFVLNAGNVVEWGPRASVFEHPQHPVTRQLLRQDIYHRSVVSGDLPDCLGNGNRAPHEVMPGHWVR